jgi:uncharacterized protein (TIGR02186 family)
VLRALLSLLFLVCLPLQVGAQQLTADLSSHLVTVRSDFEGETLVLFGALDAPLTPEDTMIVTVRGPADSVLVRRKKRVWGIWMNRQKMRFHDVPSFYRWYRTGGNTGTLPDMLRLRHQIGVDALGIVPDGAPSLTSSFRHALLERNLGNGNYRDTPGMIAFVSPTLFRTEIVFPRQVPVGAYLIDVLLLRAGQEAPIALTTPLSVSKAGIGADIAWAARKYPLRYGMAAILLAFFAGWAANTAFNRSPKSR